MSTVILLLLITAVHSVYSNIVPVVTNCVYCSTVVVTNCNTQLFVTVVTNCREAETLYTHPAVTGQLTVVTLCTVCLYSLMECGIHI